MLKKTSVLLALTAGLIFNGVLMASDSQHFKGEPSKTLEQAVKNFSVTNQKLATIMQKDKLEPIDMGEIHQLTYTLENALEKIQDELKKIEDLLEDVHQASEKGQYDKALKQGREYLSKSQKIIP